MSISLKASSTSVSITVNDLKRSLSFYVDGLGFTMGEPFNDDAGVMQGAMLTGGSASIGVSQDDFSKGRDRVKGVGMRIYIETEQDLTALAKQATDAGLTINGPMKLPWGPFGFSVTDPDGFGVTMTEPHG